MTNLLKSLAAIWGIALVVFFLIIGLNYLFFGDQTNQDSIKPLFVIVPVMGAALFTLIKFTKRNEK